MTKLSALTDLALRDAHFDAVAVGDNVLADAAWEIFVSRSLRLDGTRRDPIVTYHAFPPIPVRDFDWQAHRDSDEGGEGRSGWGRTEADAIADLREQEIDAEEDVDWEAEAERKAAEEEYQREYERDEAADDKRNARRDDPFERWADEI
jgi:hypothetical protein